MGDCEWFEIDAFYDAMIRNHLRLENLLFFIMDEADKWAKTKIDK